MQEPEKYNTVSGGEGPITNVVNVHNPSMEVHRPPDDVPNTGAAIILAPGGGHEILWVGPAGADYVPVFARRGVTTIILRYRLRADGYEPTRDAVNDAFQAIRIVRSQAAEWKIDPSKIGIIGFSAGAELSSRAALFFAESDRKHSKAHQPLCWISSRPDFVGVIYPGPTPFTGHPETTVPPNVPPSFITCAGSGDREHALWANDYFLPMLKAGIPNIEMHVYGRGGHGVRLSEEGELPYATWIDRYIDWIRDLGFLGKPGVETRAAHDVARHVAAGR